MADDRKDLPATTAPNFQQRMREFAMTCLGRQGDKLDRVLTLRDLAAAGIVKVRESYLAGGGTGGSPVEGPGPIVTKPPDLQPPPTPTGFAVSAAISNLFVECDPPLYTQGHGHAASVLYGVPVADDDPLPTFADAVELASFPGTIFSYVTNPATTWRLWLKWRTNDGVLSADPAGGINGLSVRTGVDVAKLVEAMTGPGNPFKVVTEEITLPDGSVVPPGTYTSDAYIHNGQIVNAKIANLAVDNAKVANMAVDKLIAGSLNIGAYIQSSNYVAGTSGFRINGAGFAEFSGIIARGQINATSGAIGGITIASNAVYSSNYDAGAGVGFRLGADGTLNLPNGSITAAKLNVANLAAVSATLGDVAAGSVRNGDFTGYGWPAAGGTGFYLGPAGLLMGNYNDDRYVDIRANGNLYLPGMKVENGTLYFQQASAIDTDNIVIGAVTVGTSATGNDTASLTITVPAGQTYSLLVVASFQQSSYWAQAAGATSTDERNCSLDVTTAEMLPAQQTIESFLGGFGVVYYFGPATMFRSISLTAGTYTIHADVSYTTSGAPVYVTPIYLVAYMFKR